MVTGATLSLDSTSMTGTASA
uniref:Uncharacterized protein n=1 Tax=Romanomermis culicivorax TaxID=13658 RepID=A0A915JK18_ROMCU